MAAFEVSPEAGFSIKSEPTTGSLENAQHINTARSSLALVGEFLDLDQLDAAALRPRRIAPLYLQRAHIAYRIKEWDSFRDPCIERATLAQAETTSSSVDSDQIKSFKKKLRDTLERPVLTSDKTSCSHEFFRSQVWDAGPLGSGTRLMAIYFLNATETRPPTLLSSKTFTAQAARMDGTEISVAFFFTGEENTMSDRVKNGDFKNPVGLTGVDPSLISSLAVKSNLELQPTYFEASGAQIETLGAYTALIASEDIPADRIASILTAIEPFLETLKKSDSSGTGVATNLSSVAETYEMEAREHRTQLWSSLAQFTLLTLLWMLGGLSLTSGWISRQYRSRIMREHSTLLTDTLRMHKRSSSDCVLLRELLEIAKKLDRTLLDIQHDTLQGRLSTGHREQLIHSSDTVKTEISSLCDFHVREMEATEYPQAIEFVEELVKLGYIEHSQLVSMRSQSDPITPRTRFTPADPPLFR